jgi:putative aldouronate transport system substrate-binding protein
VATNRRNVLGLMGLGAAALAGGDLLAGCSKQAGSKGAATNADAVKAVIPNYKPLTAAKPDLAGSGSVPNGYLKYPSELTDSVTTKAGTSGKAIKAIAPWWGPAPPSLGSNAYMQAMNDKLGITIDTNEADGVTYADKLSAMLGARDIPDLLCAPNWEIDKIARFGDAVKALFEDLSDYLKGDVANAYPNLASLPTAAWEYSVWANRLYAVPFPADGPYSWLLFQRKDLVESLGQKTPSSIDELYAFAKAVTNPGKGIWAFGSIFDMVQCFYGVPGSTQGGWRKKSGGGLEFKYETPEYRAALEFTAKLFKEQLVHPDVQANSKADEKSLFNAGKIVMYQDGGGAWRGMQSEQAKITPAFNMQPVPVFGVDGKPPVVKGSEKPIFWTFVKKGLGKDRVQEILRVLNVIAAPLGTKEWELREYGVEGKHFTRGADGSPAPTELGRKEIGSQYSYLAGRVPTVVKTADVPNYVQDLIGYSMNTLKYLEKELTAGIKLELPANYSKVLTPTDDKIMDVLRGRRPLGDLDQITKEWRTNGGDEGRAFLEKALADNGR